MSAQQDDVPLALRDQFPPEETAVLSGQQAIEQLGPAILPSQPSSNSEEVSPNSRSKSEMNFWSMLPFSLRLLGPLARASGSLTPGICFFLPCAGISPASASTTYHLQSLE